MVLVRELLELVRSQKICEEMGRSLLTEPLRGLDI